jgi:hypothetical protein
VNWKRINDWMNRAEWWHFWNPGSGASGGTILGLFFLIIFWWKLA